MGLRVGGSCLRESGFNHWRRRRRWRGSRCQCAQRSIHPLRKRLLILHVAVRARVDARRAELLQPLVHGFAERAELRVVRVAEGEQGKLRLLLLRRGFSVQEFPKRLRVVGRLAIAVGARDHEQRLLGYELCGGILAEVLHRRREAALARLFRDALGKILRVARLRAEQDGKRRQRPRLRRGACEVRLWRTGKQPGEKAVEIRALLWREGRVVGQDGDELVHGWRGGGVEKLKG